MAFVRNHKRLVGILLIVIMLFAYAAYALPAVRLNSASGNGMFGGSSISEAINTDFTEAETAPNGMKKVSETESLILYINTDTSAFAVQNRADGTVWYSNPVSESGITASGDILNYINSQIIVNYFDQSDYVKSVNSYYDSVKQDGMNIVPIKNGFRAEYTLGNAVYTMDMLPRVVETERFERLILNKVSDDDMLKSLKKRYKKKTVSKLSNAGAQAILNEYPKIDKEKEYYILDLSTPDYDYKKLYNIIFGFSDYTEKDLKDDNAAIDYYAEEKEPELIYIPLEVTLNSDCLSVRIPCEQIKAPEDMKIKDIQVLPYFAAADENDEGYMFVPDSSGALINFNNKKVTAPAYSVSVYGKDSSVSANGSDDKTPVAYIPVFAEKKNNAGFWCVIEEGESHAQINSIISGITSGYNQLYASFSILPVDYMTVESNGKQIVTNRYQEDYYKGNIKLTYRFTADGKSDYSDFAVNYRNYLIKKGELSLNAESRIPFIAEFVGKIECVRSIAGIKYNSYETVTTFSQADKIIEEMAEKGITLPIVKYSSWFSGSSQTTAPVNAKTASEIGGLKELQGLKESIEKSGGRLLLNSSVYRQYGNRRQFNYSVYGSRYIYNQPVRAASLNIATGEPDDTSRRYSLLSPVYLNDYLKKYISSIDKKNLNAIWFDDLGNTLSSDFKKKRNIDRQQAMELTVNAMSQTADYSVGMDMPYAYLFKYTDYACKVPLDSSKHILIDETVPFLPIVLSGCIAYSGNEFNLGGDVYQSVLKSAETGAGFYYKWMFSSNTEICELDGYEAKNLYSLNYEELIDDAAKYYKSISNDLGRFAGKPIVSHKKIGENVFQTYYENGWVAVNYNDFDFSNDEFTIKANSYVTGG